MYTPWDELESSLAAAKQNFNRLPIALITDQMKTLWTRWSAYGLQKNLASFHPKIRLFSQKDSYIIKTVESSWELEAALRLRHDVFYREMLNEPSDLGFDMDEFDLACDHLVIVDQRSEKVVGTYRLMSSNFSNRFYSAKEFDITPLLALPGNKLELGRACIQKEYRNGLIIALLWRGINQYAKAVEARYLFGCSSIPTTDLYAVTQVCAYMRDSGYMIDALALRPQPAYRLSHLPTFIARYENRDPVSLDLARKTIPPLLLSYLKAGARIGAEPALDKIFRCIDFMTILETDKLSTPHSRKFSKC